MPVSPTSSSSTSLTSLSPTISFTSISLRKLVLKKHHPSSEMSTFPPQTSSSYLSSAQFQQVRIVYRPAAPSLGPLSGPHSDWRTETPEGEQWRGRSGMKKQLQFDLPTPSTPVPIPTQSTSISSFRHVHPSDRSSSRHASTSSSSPSSHTSYYQLSHHPIQVRVEPARSSSTSPPASESASSGFYDEDDDSASTSSAFSFIEGEGMDGLHDVIVRRDSEDSQSREIGAFERQLHFARKPSLVSDQYQAFSLPDFDLSSSYDHGDAALPFSSRREQFKRRRSEAQGVGFWRSRFLASSL
ncbi:hypothetical protein BDY24DRAFT_442212 [Mrakia frigida]|uniref:uncharacterized protein n=1 Tax=Mrakia frigida TaxID=29902 RepID=UPI003FCC00A7